MAENCLYQSFTEIIAKGEGIIHNVETVKRSVKDKPKINYYSLNTNVENEKKEELSPKRKAYNKVYYALKAGKLIKPAQCEICKSTENIQAHHKDYSKPLEVDWVCQKCHVELDNQRREQE
ncbi:MAG: hypothetical protein PHN69_03775 [Candidatus Pacebacteria bacterium]|nr:hypothetical protein [Candidatus Paceibacterota bacterium]